MSPSQAVQKPGIAFAIVSACILGILIIFWPTTASMIEIWRSSETYQHCFAVIPITLWLVWQQRYRLAAEPLSPFWPGLLAIAALGFAWLLGVLGAAQVISHFALVGLAAAVVLTAFGWRWAAVLSFPLLFLFFAVPFGEALVPRLMDWTADFTVTALRLSGVPVYREGVHFVIPTGQWSVIEACSGIKFLIASLMAGSLYAWLMYRSPGRRLAFIAASIAVPIIANWLRAYLIVMVGHLSKNRLMTNEDHIVFGWILFGAIMLLLYWQAARWREDTHDVRPPGPPVVALPGRQVALTLVGVCAAILAWPALASFLMQPVGAVGQVRILAPAAAHGWQLDNAPLSAWRPDIDGANASETFVYRKGTQRVAVFIGVYHHQTQQAQVGSSINQVVRSTNEVWKQTARGEDRTAGISPSVPDPVQMAAVRGPRPSDRLLIWHWYWTGDLPTTSAGRTKLELARARLLRRPDDALWIAVYAPVDDDRTAARQSLQDFVRDMGPSLHEAFTGTGRDERS
jgi:exosortase A